jgi:hypothetical protein
LDDNGCHLQPGLDLGIKLGNFRNDGRAVLQKTITAKHEKEILLRSGSGTWPEGSG